MTSAAITTITRTEEQQLEAVRTLLGVETGHDVVEPLKTLLTLVRELRQTLLVTVAVNEATIRNLRKQVLDIQTILEGWT